MKVKLEEKKLTKIFVGLILVSAVILILGFLFLQIRPHYSVKTSEGNVYVFREDVRRAEKVPVYPDEIKLRERFLDAALTNITYVFVPSETKSYGQYVVWAVEFGFKLTQFYNSIGYVEGEANIMAQAVDSVSNITNEPTNLKLIMVPLNQATENKIVVDENRVYIYGRTVEEMDYAVMKTILVALGNWTLAS